MFGALTDPHPKMKLFGDWMKKLFKTCFITQTGECDSLANRLDGQEYPLRFWVAE